MATGRNRLISVHNTSKSRIAACVAVFLVAQDSACVGTCRASESGAANRRDAGAFRSVRQREANVGKEKAPGDFCLTLSNQRLYVPWGLRMNLFFRNGGNQFLAVSRAFELDNQHSIQRLVPQVEGL